MGERGTLPPARGRSKGTPYLLPAIQDTTPDSDSIPTVWSAGLFHGTVDRRRSGDLPLRLRLRDHHVVLAVGGGQRRIPAGGIGLRIGGRARMGGAANQADGVRNALAKGGAAGVAVEVQVAGLNRNGLCIGGRCQWVGRKQQSCG